MISLKPLNILQISSYGFAKTLKTTQTLVFIGLLSFSIPAFSTIEIVDIDNASNITGLDDDEEALVVFGGTAGDAGAGTGEGSCAEKVNTSTCNNCSETYTACNERRIHDNLILRIDIKSDSATGDAIITDSDGDTEITGELNSPQITGPADSAELAVTWSSVCSLLGAASCETDVTASIRVGVDGNNDNLLDSSDDDFATISIKLQRSAGQVDINGDQTSEHKACDSADIGSQDGLCNFTVIPGDGKVFIRDLAAPDGFPTTSNNIVFEKIRFLCAEGPAAFDVTGFNNVTPKTVCGDLEIEEESDGSFVLSDEIIDGLQNDQGYYFRVASIDQAGNIGYFTPGDGSLDQTCTDGGTTCHFAQPGEVLGVLADDTNCFITTAAYNSSLHSKVETFRKFRDRFLISNRLGSQFVDSYYQHGPGAARWLNRNIEFKPLVRALLWPTWLFAELSLQTHWVVAMIVYGLLLASLLIMIKVLRSRLTPQRIKTLSIGIVFLFAISISVSPNAYAEEDTINIEGSEEEIAEAEDDEDEDEEEEELAEELDEERPPAEAPYPGVVENGFEKKQSNKNSNKKTVNRKTTSKEKQPETIQFMPDGPKARVQSDGSYIYDRIESPLEGSFAFHLGIFGPLDIQNPSNLFTFEDIYGQQPGPVLFFDWDWTLTRGAGHINVRFTTGAYFAQGKGRFADPARADEEPLEQFTFVLFPNQVTLQYKFQYSDTQLFVPYIEGGGGYFTFAEFRDDGGDPKLGGSLVAVGGGGLQILMDWIEPRYAANLDRDYGVNHTWFLAEFKAIVGLDDTFDFTSALINIGFLVEY